MIFFERVHHPALINNFMWIKIHIDILISIINRWLILGIIIELALQFLNIFLPIAPVSQSNRISQ